MLKLWRKPSRHAIAVRNAAFSGFIFADVDKGEGVPTCSSSASRLDNFMPHALARQIGPLMAGARNITRPVSLLIGRPWRGKISCRYILARL